MESVTQTRTFNCDIVCYMAKERTYTAPQVIAAIADAMEVDPSQVRLLYDDEGNVIPQVSDEPQSAPPAEATEGADTEAAAAGDGTESAPSRTGMEALADMVAERMGASTQQTQNPNVPPASQRKPTRKAPPAIPKPADPLEMSPEDFDKHLMSLMGEGADK